MKGLNPMFFKRKLGLRICLLLLGLALGGSACRSTRSSELLESEADIAYKAGNIVRITPARNQGAIGFCWSYGMMGMIESLQLKRKGESVTLSPEAFGFYHYVSLLKAFFADEDGLDKFRNLDVDGGGLDGNSMVDSAEYSSAPVLLKAYGVIPEEVYRKKFPSTVQSIDDAMKFHMGIQDRINALVAKKGKAYLHTMSEADIINEIMISTDPAGYTSAPPQSFTFRGKIYTPQSFLKDFLKIDPTALTVKAVYSERQQARPSNVEQVTLEQFIKDADENLKAGIPLPFRVDIDNTRLILGTFSKNGAQPAAKGKRPAPFSSSGGHVMVFVGPTKNMLSESKDEDRFIIKNSWGAGFDPTSPTPSDGLYLMEIGYLKAMLESGYYLAALMPKQAGKAPFLP